MDTNRTDFDKWYEEKQELISNMSLGQVKNERNDLKNTLEGLHLLMKDDMTEGRKKYLKGRRKFVTQLLAYTKERIKIFNVITHNGTPHNVALRFLQVACDYLPLKTFQTLYGLSMSDMERKQITIDEVKDFMAEYDKSITPICTCKKDSIGNIGGASNTCPEHGKPPCTKEICYCNNKGVCLDQRWKLK